MRWRRSPCNSRFLSRWCVLGSLLDPLTLLIKGPESHYVTSSLVRRQGASPLLLWKTRDVCVCVCMYLCLLLFGCVAPYPAVSRSIWQLVAGFQTYETPEVVA